MALISLGNGNSQSVKSVLSKSLTNLCDLIFDEKKNKNLHKSLILSTCSVIIRQSHISRLSNPISESIHLFAIKFLLSSYIKALQPVLKIFNWRCSEQTSYNHQCSLLTYRENGVCRTGSRRCGAPIGYNRAGP